MLDDDKKQKLVENFLQVFDGFKHDSIADGYDLIPFAVMSSSASRDMFMLGGEVYDKYFTMSNSQRIGSEYDHSGISKNFLNACVWLWIMFEGPELYLHKNGHYPVDMWTFTWLAFNNDWDDLEPLLNTEI